MKVKYDLSDFNKKMKNMAQYGIGFATEAKRSEGKLARKLGEASIDGFYDFLDAMARMHPEMLHHVYEWDRVGNPGARLYEVKTTGASARAITINADFLPSRSTSDQYSTPFVNKAEVMELGLPVVIERVNAQSLFFTQDGQEFFRMGPIVIENPGGEAVRGSFLRFFEMFYNRYFEDIYLNSINFYKHMSETTEFTKNFEAGVRRGGYNVGRRAAEKWINSAPGGNNGNL